jgi:hypothetical protein
MMSPSLEHDSGNAFVAIARRARTTPGPWLVVCEIAGFTSALAIYALVPSHSSAALPFLAAGAFGLWGTIDHVLESPPRVRSWRRSALRALQLLTSAAGIACAVATGFVLAGWLMGTFVL